MSFLSPEILFLTKYATPPLIGAFIGYFTNMVAIKMLFLPLKPWKIGPLRVPMTPGVIPSKRLELADNLGEVVGDHLLTSEEIGKGLQQDAFQRHLLNLIQGRLEGVLQKDLGPLASIVPTKFRIYFDIGRKTLTYQIKEQIRSYIGSAAFTERVESALDQRLERFLEFEVGTLLSGTQRETAYGFIEKNIAKMLLSEAMEQWVEDLVQHKVYGTLRQEKSLADLLPDTLLVLFQTAVEKQTPALLTRLATLVSEPAVRDKIVKGACAGVDSFIDSLGSMADMVRGFLRMETVEEKIRAYLIEKNDDIVLWLQSEEVQVRVVEVIRERSREFLQKPIVKLIKANDEIVINQFCTECARQLLQILRGKEVAATLTSMIKSNVEIHFESRATSLREVGAALLGEQSFAAAKTRIITELSTVVQSPETLDNIDSLVDTLITSLLQKRLGKMANIVPAGVREGMAQSLQKMASTMLATEVPGLVESLNIRKIVTEKVNSLDILKLEGLLLSIMEEQFKYINLFGALLGFFIGCGNLLFL
jgi:uncharacterized membrane protein YheB (UPF0754 family)